MTHRVGDRVVYHADDRYIGWVTAVRPGTIDVEYYGNQIQESDPQRITYTQPSSWKIVKKFERKKSGFGIFWKKMQENHPCV